MSPPLRVLTYNIRKGKGASGREPPGVGAIARELGNYAPDILLCQEVFHPRGRRGGQSHDLAEGLRLAAYYRPNKRRRVGHHGNATFTNLPVDRVENHDLSTNPIERRGALYVRLRVGARPLHVFNVHLGLSGRQRRTQLRRLTTLLADCGRRQEAVLLAGDFNDWNRQLDRLIVDELGFSSSFGPTSHPRTWHARRPVLSLDRVYLRQARAKSAMRLDGDAWRDLSDHLPLLVQVEVI